MPRYNHQQINENYLKKILDTNTIYVGYKKATKYKAFFWYTSS